MKLLRISALALATTAAAGAVSAGDWTGAYGGVHLGYGDFSASGGTSASTNDSTYGLQLGYDYDMGDWVLGGRLDYDGTNVNVAGVKVDSIARLGMRGGFDTGPGLIYGIAGVAKVDTNTAGDDNGWFAGVGYEHMMMDNVSLSGEVLYHKIDNFNGTNVNGEATVFNVGVNYRF